MKPESTKNQLTPTYPMEDSERSHCGANTMRAASKWEQHAMQSGTGARSARHLCGRGGATAMAELERSHRHFADGQPIGPCANVVAPRLQGFSTFTQRRSR